MGCFLCSGESSIPKKQQKQRTSNEKSNRCGRDDHEKTTQDTTLKVSPPKFVKEDRPFIEQSAAEAMAREPDVSRRPCEGDANASKAWTLASLT